MCLNDIPALRRKAGLPYVNVKDIGPYVKIGFRCQTICHASDFGGIDMPLIA